jgi:AraC-like DNA-binding protein
MTRVLRERFAGAGVEDIDWRRPLHALATSGAGAIREAAALANVSERQFRRLFQERYGVPPKQYQRVLRVDRLLRQLHPAPWETDALSGIPLEFADQPHIIREFKALTGMTPSTYLRRKRDAEDRVVRSVAAEGILPPDGV